MNEPDRCVTGLDEKIAFLGSPAAYAEAAAQRIEQIETHFSYVFLTERHVYKLKKPLSGDRFDFTSCAARRQNAIVELRLNRRLAPGVYLAIVPLTREPGGGLALGGGGAIVDWLIKMVRLPTERMLDRRIRRNDWHYADLQTLGARLAHFFAAAAPVTLAPPVFFDRLRAECRMSRQAFATGDPARRERARRIARHIEAFITREQPTLLRRLGERRLVDGHGDLRPEHICLGSAPLIIDCLEFSAALRALDPVDELAFLAMECTRLGAPQIGPILFRHYRRRTGDQPAPALIDFYTAFRALVRARIAIRHLAEQPMRDPTKWPKRADAYLALAAQALRRIEP